jgi:hypothetical protein
MIEFNGTDVAFSTKLRNKSDEITEALLEKTNELSGKLVEKIVGKLSGEVLQTRSGNLLESVQEVPAELVANEVVGGVVVGDEKAPYAEVQELGGEKAYKIVPVDKKALRFLLDNKEFFAKQVNHPPLPARSFVGSSLEEMQSEVEFELKEAILLASL